MKIAGEIFATEQLGGETIYRVNTDMGKLNIRTQSSWDETRGNIEIQFSLDKVMVFNKEGNIIKKDAETMGKINKLRTNKELVSV